jgi:hypothetical protein
MEPNPYQSPPAVGQDRPTDDGAVLFGVAVRTVALVSMVYGGGSYFAWSAAYSWLDTPEGVRKGSLAIGIYYIFIGLLLFGFAPLVVRLNYFVKRKSKA